MSFPYLKRNLSTIFISPFPVNSCPSNHICSFLAMMSLRSPPTGMPTSWLAPAPTIKTVFDESIAYASRCGSARRLPLNQPRHGSAALGVAGLGVTLHGQFILRYALLEI